jgi:tight adherence protein C
VILIALLALVSLGVAVASLVAALGAAGARTAENLGQIGAYGYQAPAGAAAPAPTTHRLDDVAAAIGEWMGQRFGALREDVIQQRLVAAGFFGVGARRFLGYRVLLALGLPIVLTWLLVAAGAGVAAIAILGLAAAIGGWVAPSVVVSRRGAERLEQVDDGLPELIDLLVVTVEAGVGFSSALRMAAERVDGPLGDEVRLTIQQQDLGLSTLEALEGWLGRCDTPAVRAFVQAMVQGDRLGVSVGHILRNLAEEMRKRRRQRAEERAQKAPIKMLFPLVFLIFPALFIVVLGPAAYHIADTFAGR